MQKITKEDSTETTNTDELNGDSPHWGLYRDKSYRGLYRDSHYWRNVRTHPPLQSWSPGRACWTQGWPPAAGTRRGAPPASCTTPAACTVCTLYSILINRRPTPNGVFWYTYTYMDMELPVNMVVLMWIPTTLAYGNTYHTTTVHTVFGNTYHIATVYEISTILILYKK